jgi:hypothetical protein
MPSFSERHGYSQPKGITYRDELPVGLRIPIFEILEREVPSDFLWKRIKKLLNPLIRMEQMTIMMIGSKERTTTQSQRNGYF